MPERFLQPQSSSLRADSDPTAVFADDDWLPNQVRSGSDLMYSIAYPAILFLISSRTLERT